MLKPLQASPPRNVKTEFDHIRVQDVMHRGIFTCTGDAPLGEVAGVMAKHRVHAVVVTNRESRRPVGVVSDLDIVAAMASGAEPSALQTAATEPLSISAEDSLHRAAQLMAEHSVSHLVVHDPGAGDPIGVISTLDLAAAFSTIDEEGGDDGR
jgi:CBS domain-containing protein